MCTRFDWITLHVTNSRDLYMAASCTSQISGEIGNRDCGLFRCLSGLLGGPDESAAWRRMSVLARTYLQDPLTKSGFLGQLFQVLRVRIVIERKVRLHCA